MSSTAQHRDVLSGLLARTSDNAAFYTVLTAAEAVHVINEKAGLAADPRYRLIRIDHRLGMVGDNEFEIALVDDAESSVAYYHKVTLSRPSGVSSRHLAHNLVWRSANMRHSLALRDISQKVLFSYLVDTYDILLAMDAMTDGGIFYWYRQVSKAIEKGLHVYAYDCTTQGLQPLPTQRSLNDLQDQVWTGANQQDLRAIVSIFALVNLPVIDVLK